MKNSLKVRIVSIRLGGVAPFEDGATLSFVASKERANRHFLYPIPRFRLSLLPVVALYGEAGSGKSTLLKALGAIFATVREASFGPILSLRSSSETRELSLSVVISVDDRLYEYVVALRDGSVVKEALISATTTGDDVLFLVDSDGSTPIVVPTLVTAGHLLGRFDGPRGEDVAAIVTSLGKAAYVDPIDSLVNREIVVETALLPQLNVFLEAISQNPSELLTNLVRDVSDGDGPSQGTSREVGGEGLTKLSLSYLSTSEAALVAIAGALVSQMAHSGGGVVAIDNFDALLDFRIASFILGKINKAIEDGHLMSVFLGMKDSVFFDQSYFRRDQLVLVGGEGDDSSIISLAEISQLRYDRDVRKMYINRTFDSL